MSDPDTTTRRLFVKTAGAAAVGAMSCLTGIAVRNSSDQRKPVSIADLVRLRQSC